MDRSRSSLRFQDRQRPASPDVGGVQSPQGTPFMPDNDLTRRDLIKSAGAAAVVAAPFIQTVKAANDQVQYGMIGTGSRGSYLLKHLKEIDTRALRGVVRHPAYATRPWRGDHRQQSGEILGPSRDAQPQRSRRRVRDHAPVYAFRHHARRPAIGAARVLRKVSGVQADGSSRTPLVGGGASQADFADRVAAALQRFLSDRETDGGQGHSGQRSPYPRAVAPQHD